MKPNFQKCEELATELLVTSDVYQFPIDVRKLNYKQNLIIDSMQNYATITKIDVNELIRNGHYNDAFIIRRRDISIILYNEMTHSNERSYWNLGHEVGHAVLEHTNDGPREEVEAHFFTAQLFMPDPIIHELLIRGVTISKKFLIKTFGVSERAAMKKIETIRKTSWKHEEGYQFQYKDILLFKFNDFINRIAPKIEDDYPQENDLYSFGPQYQNPFFRRHTFYDT